MSTKLTMLPTDQKINVLYIIWSLGLGGAEKVVIDLCKNIDKDKFHPIVCCLNDKGIFADELEDVGIEVIPLYKKPKFDPYIIYKIYKLIKKKQIDIVHAHLWTANFWGRIAAKLAGVKVIVITEHNVDVWKRRAHFWADSLLASITNKIIAVSNKVKEFYIKMTKINPNKFITIYNGVDLTKFNIQINVLEKRKEFGIEPSDKVVVIIGRLEAAKAHHVFLKALKEVINKIQNFKALIIGDGSLKQEIILLTKELNLQNNVIITGLRKDIPELLSIADLFVLSSTREGFPITLLEAMSCGIPAVVTNVGGNSELCINGETGIIVEPNNPKALAEAILTLLTDQNLSSNFSKASKVRIQTLFTAEIMAKNHEALYLKLFNKTT